MKRIIMAICLMLMSVLCFGSNNNVKINKEECCITKMVDISFAWKSVYNKLQKRSRPYNIHNKLQK
jgi:hypothetical protein